jgi:hypothetical protein
MFAPAAHDLHDMLTDLFVGHAIAPRPVQQMTTRKLSFHWPGWDWDSYRADAASDVASEITAGMLTNWKRPIACSRRNRPALRAKGHQSR